MKDFQWNQYGICENPKSVTIEKVGTYLAKIKTACNSSGKWSYGIEVKKRYLSHHGGGWGVSLKRCDYDTEYQAHVDAVAYIKNHYFQEDHAHDRSARRELDMFLNPQLSLF